MIRVKEEPDDVCRFCSNPTLYGDHDRHENSAGSTITPEIYITAHFIKWSDDYGGHKLETPEMDTGTWGVFDPVDNLIIISAAAVNLEATYDNYAFRGEFGKEGDYDNYRLSWLYSWFLKLFILTTNHEFLHAIMCEFDFTEEQEEWIIEKMGWT